MSVVSMATAESTASVTLRAPRTIRIGLLGLGKVVVVPGFLAAGRCGTVVH
jgi:hypothetical protein